jgi:saccharopine dehydrogenase-like NADP-dependent oxidoreductase
LIGVVGAGVTGARVVEYLIQRGHHIALYDANQYRAQQLAALHRNNGFHVSSVEPTKIGTCEVAVLACSAPHNEIAVRLLRSGAHVVSISDDLDDITALLELNQHATLWERSLVVGAAMSPGLSGVIAHHVAQRFDSIDEIHVALHGTGGPDCARQHHKSLGGQSIGWHDTDWLRRPGGSGRELCWFPEPVGAYDCYRASLPDPVLLKRAMPHLQRVTARVSATRRDRFTSRLPMLAPPHAEGGMGALRVEVRGNIGTARCVEVAGIADRVAQAAGLLAAVVTHGLHTNEITGTGVRVLGDATMPNAWLYRQLIANGLRVHRFVGSL